MLKNGDCLCMLRKRMSKKKRVSLLLLHTQLLYLLLAKENKMKWVRMPVWWLRICWCCCWGFRMLFWPVYVCGGVSVCASYYCACAAYTAYRNIATLWKPIAEFAFMRQGTFIETCCFSVSWDLLFCWLERGWNLEILWMCAYLYSLTSKFWTICSTFSHAHDIHIYVCMNGWMYIHIYKANAITIPLLLICSPLFSLSSSCSKNT